MWYGWFSIENQPTEIHNHRDDKFAVRKIKFICRFITKPDTECNKYKLNRTTQHTKLNGGLMENSSNIHVTKYQTMTKSGTCVSPLNSSSTLPPIDHTTVFPDLLRAALSKL